MQSVSKALEVGPRIVLQSFDQVAAAISSHANECLRQGSMIYRHLLAPGLLFHLCGLLESMPFEGRRFAESKRC